MAVSETASPRPRPARLAAALAFALAVGPGAPEPAWPAPAVEPIRFARGASSAVVRGAVVRGERALFSVEAREGQRMSLRVTSPERNAVFQLHAPGARPETDGSVLEVAGEALPGAGEGDDATRWTGALPRSGSYLIVVGATRGNAAYRLAVTIR